MAEYWSEYRICMEQTLIYLFSKINKIYIDEGKNKSINIMQSKEISQVKFNLKTASSN